MNFKRLQEQAYDHLREMVLGGEFNLDEVYSETSIAKKLGISRTPIRDALQRLSHDGLIDIMPSKGFRVHALTYKDIVEIYQMRCAVEGYCARLIAEHRTSPAAQRALSGMSDLLMEQKRLNDVHAPVEQLVELDYTFHTQIISFSENQVFTEIYSNQMYRMRIITFEGQEREKRRASSLEEHIRLVDTLLHDDADAAYASVIAHYQNMIDATRIATFHPQLAKEVQSAAAFR